MAKFDIAIGVPNAKQSEFIAACRWHWGQVDDGAGGQRDLTVMEIKAKFKAAMKSSMQDIFTRHKKSIRDKSSLNDAIDIT